MQEWIKIHMRIYHIFAEINIYCVHLIAYIYVHARARPSPFHAHARAHIHTHTHNTSCALRISALTTVAFQSGYASWRKEFRCIELRSMFVRMISWFSRMETRAKGMSQKIFSSMRIYIYIDIDIRRYDMCFYVYMYKYVL